MNQVHVTRSGNGKWFAVAAAVAIAAGGIFWWMHGQNDTDGGRVTDASGAASGAAVANASASMATPSPAEVQNIVNQQAEANKEIERQPRWKPISGPVKDRPSWVSPIEWSMLKGVSQQHPDPDKELTRLVNFLHYTKTLELWQELPKNADPAKRKDLAEQLLDDLPTRVSKGEVALKDAQTTLPQLLADIEPNATQRQKRQEDIGKQLIKAEDGRKAAEAAEAAAKAQTPATQQ